MCFIGNKT